MANFKVKASFANSIRWIAKNDQPGMMDASAIARLASVQLAASLFAKEPLEAALEVIKERARLTASEKTIASEDETAQSLTLDGSSNHVEA